MAITRRRFVASSTTGLAAILATRVAPAVGQTREISYLCWNTFAPAPAYDGTTTSRVTV